MSRIAAVPIPGNLLRFSFCSFPELPRLSRGEPHGWEVVQLVGLQTLDLAILVRVQASQPNFSMSVGPSSNLTSDLLTYLLGKMPENHVNDEAGDAISFCIVAVSSGHSRCT